MKTEKKLKPYHNMNIKYYHLQKNDKWQINYKLKFFEKKNDRPSEKSGKINFSVETNKDVSFTWNITKRTNLKWKIGTWVSF